MRSTSRRAFQMCNYGNSTEILHTDSLREHSVVPIKRSASGMRMKCHGMPQPRKVQPLSHRSLDQRATSAHQFQNKHKTGASASRRVSNVATRGAWCGGSHCLLASSASRSCSTCQSFLRHLPFGHLGLQVDGTAIYKCPHFSCSSALFRCIRAADVLACGVSPDWCKLMESGKLP